MESFSLDKLRELCEAGRWSEAEDEARDIAYICRQNHLILHPPFYLRKPPPCHWSPRERIHGVLSRISRNRIIEGPDARDLVVRMARKWSGNSGNTMRAFSHLYSQGRYWRGDWRWDRMEDYSALTKLARENKWQWCDLKKRGADVRRKKLNALDLEETALSEARGVLTSLNRAIRERRPAHA